MALLVDVFAGAAHPFRLHPAELNLVGLAQLGQCLLEEPLVLLQDGLAWKGQLCVLCQLVIDLEHGRDVSLLLSRQELVDELVELGQVGFL